MTVVQILLDEPTSIKCEAYWCLHPDTTSNLEPRSLNPLSALWGREGSVHEFQKCPVSEAAGGWPCVAEISMHSAEEEEISIEISC